ncbi:hypothetical protein ACS0TY_025963 [Phlomoides rotata]
MEEAVAGGILGAAAQAVIEKLFSLISLKFNQVEDFIGDMDNLKNNFMWIQETLHDAGMQHITSRIVKLWLRKLEQVSNEAYHALDEFHYHLLREMRNNMEAQTTVMKKLKSVFSGSYSNDPRQILGRKVKDINEKLDSLINREANYIGIHQMILGRVSNTQGVGAGVSASPETDSFTVDPVFIGREKDVSAIVEVLANIPTERVLSVLPIVGMGGLGKTTLAREVFHHGRVSSRFPTRIWVHVSALFDPITIFKKILATLTLEKVEIENKEAVLIKLQGALQNKTFLLVLDDVWNQDRRMWEDLINPLSRICSTMGNSIIVTTRNSKVGSVVGTLPTYELQGLSEDNCWSIIKTKALGEREFPLEIQTVGRNIAMRCKGLPLAANVVGGLLCGKSKDEWVSIEQNWLSNVDGDENNISKILRLSFHHLPSPSLKKCFAYCSFFRKGEFIRRENLIELWMAEGFLQSSQTSDMESVGNKYFNLLLQNSLLQVVSRDEYGRVNRCSMHDLVHDLASSISNEIYKGRYIRWECNGDASRRIPKEQAKWCHALSYKGPISGITFSDFKSLYSLTLISYDDEELPDSIRELQHLRYLDISNTRIKHLPDSIGELYHLQTFRSSVKELKLPSTLRYLFNLRHLHVSVDTELPPHVGMLTSLRTLPYFKLRDEEGHRIIELESLNNLQWALEINNLEKVQGVEESEKANLIQKLGIVRLVLRWDTEWREDEINDEDVLKGLQPHPNLKMLEISNFNGASFPSWTLKMAVCLEGHWVGLHNLMEITLSNCEKCEEIPMLGHLPHLKYLCLRRLSNVKSIGSSFYGISCSSNTRICKEIIVFPALERLQLRGMINLRKWVEVETSSASDLNVFPRLKYLKICECRQLRIVPSQFPCLRELEIQYMNSGLPLANICGIKLTSLAKLKIYRLRGLADLPNWLFQNNQNLSVLDIRDCPNLRTIPDGLQTLNSLQELTIRECPSLNSIPTDFQCEVGLRSLKMLSIGTPIGPPNSASLKKAIHGILQSQSLRSLYLRGMKNWEFLLDEVQHLTALSELYLDDLGIEELPEWIGNLSSLQTLSLENCKKLRSLPSVETMRRLTNLTYLYIVRCSLLKDRGLVRQSDDDDDPEWPKISHIPNISSPVTLFFGMIRRLESMKAEMNYL